MKKRKILVVDDEMVLLRTMQFGLERTGRFIVRAINDPRRAEAAAREFGPDLVVLDVAMPGMDGGDVAARIWESEGLQDTPIIFQTAVITKAEAQSHQSGREVFLSKPTSLAELRSMIDRLCPAQVEFA